MHDVDRTQLEYGSELSEYGEIPELTSEQYEYSGEFGNILGSIFGEAQAEGAFEGSGYEFGESSSGEVMEDELASGMLEVSNEQELDHFLGSLIKKAASGVGKFISSPAGKALGGILKQVAKKALPIAGGALGTFIGGPVGGALGGKLASMAGDAFGLEYEGLSPEDRDFEVAKRYVRFAHDAARRVAAHPHQHINPTAVAKAAVVEAAKRYAPGLLAPLAAAAGAYRPRPATAPAYPSAAQPAAGYAAVPPAYPSAPRPVPRPFGPAAPPTYAATDYGTYSTGQVCPSCGTAPVRYRRQGKWIRRGRHIVLLGV